MRPYLSGIALLFAILGPGLPATAQAPTKIDVNPDAEIGARVGQLSPDFKLKTLTGSTVSLSDLKGRPVVVYFWGTWCPPCRSEMPLLVAAAGADKEAGLEVLAVNGIDQELTRKDINKFVAEFRMPFPVLLDEKGKTRKLYGVIALPTFVFVGSDGLVRAVNSGPISPAVLDRKLAEILPPR